MQLFLAARLLRQARQILGRFWCRAPSTPGPRGVIGAGATDALGQAITVSMPGTDTSTIILGMTALTLTPTTGAGTGTDFSAVLAPTILR